MKQNLDVLKTEIFEHLESQGLVIFPSMSRALDGLPTIAWDADRYPDFKKFVQAGVAAGVKLFSLHAHEFSADYAESAAEELDDTNLTAEERRTIERRLRELRAYDGFTCSIELAFDLGTRVYVFELRTEWYEEFNDLLDEITAASADDDEDEGPIGGYFSNN